MRESGSTEQCIYHLRIMKIATIIEEYFKYVTSLYVRNRYCPKLSECTLKRIKTRKVRAFA